MQLPMYSARSLFRRSALGIVAMMVFPLLSLSQWTRISSFSSGSVRALLVTDSVWFEGTSDGGIDRTTDQGSYWQEVKSVLNVYALASVGTNFFAGIWGGGVLRSTDNGTNWSPVNDGLTNTGVRSLAALGSSLFAGTYGGGIFRSTNDGTSWTALNTGLTEPIVYSLAVSGANLYAGTNGYLIVSTDGGTSWTDISGDLPLPDILAIAVAGSDIYVGTNGYYVYRSTNNGTSWTQLNSGFDPSEDYVYALAVSGGSIFAGTEGGGVYLSKDNGANWAAVDSGLTGYHIQCFAFSGETLLAGSGGEGVWKRPLSEMVTSVPAVGGIPSGFRLDQNYPNPFNPSTTITFSIPTSSFVSLKVFDTLGREVSDILSEELTAGVYSREWNDPGLVSGVYLCRLHAVPASGGVSFSETKRLTILR